MARSIYFYTDSRVLGGAELALLMLMKHLDEERWKATLVLDADPGAEPVARLAAASGVPIRRVPPMPLGIDGAWRARHLVRMLRGARPDLFHAHLSWPLAAKWGLAAAVVARIPSVATVHLIPEFELGRSSHLQLRFLSRRVGRIIAVSGAVAAELVERFSWPAEKISVVYNAVEVERFGAEGSPALRAELGVSAGRPLVLTPARLEKQKGHPALLQAATHLPDAVFAFAGDGPDRGKLEALAADLEVADRVLFLGHRTDVPDLLAACDVFALPSLYEGSSLAVLEAMAARRPVVSSAIGGTDELIADGEDGVLVPPGDAEALAEALRPLLADQRSRATLAGRAREKAERLFSPRAMASGTEAVYEELLAGAGPAAD